MIFNQALTMSKNIFKNRGARNESTVAYFDDELSDNINRIFSLKEKGKINDGETNFLIKKAIEVHVKEDVKDSFNFLISNEKPQNKVFMLKYSNYKFYA